MLTVTQAWKDAISRNGAQPCLLVTIDLDGVTSHSFVMADTSLLTFPNLVVKAGPVGARMDPRTRKATISEWSIGFADDGEGSAIRDLVSGSRLFGKGISVKLGTPDLTSSSDWADLWTGSIYEVEPEPGLLTLRCKDLLGLGKTDTDPARATNQHPLQRIQELLEDANVAAAKIDTAVSFDPDTYAAGTYPMSHWNIGRGLHGEFNRVGSEPMDNLAQINELCEIMFGALYVGEDGKIRIATFDPAGSTVDDWTADDIGEFKQTATFGSSIVNRAEVSCGWKGEGSNNQTGIIGTEGSGAPSLQSGVVSEYLYVHEEEDTDSQTNWVYPGQAKRVLAQKVGTKWVGVESNTSAVLDSATGAGGSYILLDGWVSSFCGMPRRTSGTLDGTADYGLSSTRTAYHLFVSDDGLACEVVELDLCTEGTDHVLISEYEEYAGFGGWFGGQQADLDTLLSARNLTPTLTGSVQKGTFQIKARGALGTSALTWPADTRVVDITIAVAMARRIIDRYSDGVAEVEVTTNLSKHAVQIGDMVTLTCDLFLTYGKDGITSADNWEVTGKEVLLTDDVPKIKWKLAHVRPAPSPTRTWKDRLNDHPTGQFILPPTSTNAGTGLYDSFVNDGLTTTVGGLDVTIAAGRITGPRGPAISVPGVVKTVAANKDHYVFYDAMRHALSMRTVATAASAPTPTRWMSAVTKAVAGGASATVSDTRLPWRLGYIDLKDTDATPVADRRWQLKDGEFQAATTAGVEGQYVRGASLKEGTGPLTHLTAAGLLDFTQAHTGKGELATTTSVFASGEDGAFDFDGTNTYATYASTTGAAPNLVYTLIRDVDATAITVRTGKTLRTGGYKIHTLSLTLAGTAIIHNDGNAGATATSQTGATKQGQTTGFTLGGGEDGGDGGTGGNVGGNSATQGNAGSSISIGKGGAGGAGGLASSATYPGAGGGAAGTVTATKAATRQLANLFSMAQFLSGTLSRISGGAGGGGGGGGGSSDPGALVGGGGGSGGSGAGVILIAALAIILDSWTGRISTNGGAGGQGWVNTGGAAAGDGGGGGGGGGGWTRVVYGSVTGGTLVSGTNVLADGGAGGAAVGTAAAGSAGSDGTVDIVDLGS